MSGPDCIFCQIANRKINTPFVYEDEQAVAFRDINPQAPVHILVIPKKHIESLDSIELQHKELMGHILWVSKKIASDESLPKNGYRVVLNTGAKAGQTVFHLHAHVLGGRSFN